MRKTLTPEHRRKLSESMKRYKKDNPTINTEETRKKQSEGMKLFWDKIKALQNKE